MKPADIFWRDDGIPEAAGYGDVYFSRAGGLEETRYVFLQHNDLPERFRHCDTFTIGETGFGTGLNFLATWQAFVKDAPPHATLHYISAEKHPLRYADLERAHEAWPELADYAAELRRAYPAPAPGIHRLILAGGRVRLTLLYGDALDMFSAINARIDAWYLDGFAPASNPDMWQEKLLAELPRLSAPGATVATFTAAGQVRRALASAGFSMEKVKGFGHKRDMLRGRLADTISGSIHISSPLPTPPPEGGGNPPLPLVRGLGRGCYHTPPSSVIIIGAGAAGCATAYALAMRGIPVTLIDRQPHAAMATSANAAAILFPFSSRAWMPQTRFYLSGLHFTHQQVEGLRQKGHPIAGAFCGMVQCPKPSQDTARLLEIPTLLGLDETIVRAVDAAEASQISGLELTQGGLFWPGSGWYSLADYCRACLTHPLITTRFNTGITALEQTGEGWAALSGAETIAEAPALVLANAQEALQLAPALALPLATVRGQVTILPENAATHALKTVVCFGAYLTPAHQGTHHLGATYEHNRHDTAIYEDSHHANLALLEIALRDLPPTVTSTLGGWAGIRTTTPDKLPLVGETSLPGLYTTLGHGSRAALSCPLAGEIIASTLTGETIPLEQDLLQSISPMRFQKDISKNSSF